LLFRGLGTAHDLRGYADQPRLVNRYAWALHRPCRSRHLDRSGLARPAEETEEDATGIVLAPDLLEPPPFLGGIGPSHPRWILDDVRLSDVMLPGERPQDRDDLILPLRVRGVVRGVLPDRPRAAVRGRLHRQGHVRGRHE